MKNVLFKRKGKHKAVGCFCMICFVDIFIKTSFIFAKNLLLNCLETSIFGKSRKDNGGGSLLHFFF